MSGWTPNKHLREKLLCVCVVWQAGFSQSVDQMHQLLGRVRACDIVVLTLSPLFGKVSGKGRIPKTDIFGGVVKGVAQIPRASFFHV